jgi:tetratricopeptide (TPR) repeat protein
MRLAFFYVALLAVVSGCATTSQQQPAYTVDQLRDMGEKCLAAGEAPQALKYLTEAEQKKPNDAVIEYDLGLAYDQRGLKDQALSHLQNALKIKPDYPEALNTMGYIYATRGQFELARGAFQKALDDPFYKTPQLAAYNLGRLYEKNGDIERALTYYQQAVKFDQNYAIAWLRIGQLSERLSRNDEARHAYGNAVRTSPDLAEAHLRFGILSYNAGDLETALHSLSRIGEIAPNTDMADEARRYLEKIDAAMHRRARSRSSSHAPVETIPDEGIQREQMNEDYPSNLQLNSSPAPRLENSASKAAVPDDKSSSAQGSIAEGPELQSYRYMVQIGSFVDREKAEEMKSRLEAKGYNAALKSLKHPKLGKVFVIQLEPVNSVSKATTLMTQLGSEIEGDPVIIKIPAR